MIHPLEGPSLRITAYIGLEDTYDDRPMYRALMDQARTQGCAGATVVRGVTGFGPSSRGEAKHALRMSTDEPIMVQVIDEPNRIAALGEVWASMVKSGLITVENCSVVFYGAEMGDEK